MTTPTLPPDVAAVIEQIDRELSHRAKNPKTTGGQIVINERQYLILRAHITAAGETE